MCFIRTKESKVLVSKRGIKVYKIGTYADESTFKPFFRSYFKYFTNQSVFENIQFTDTINCGFHSYINCKLVPFYNNVNLYSCGKLILGVCLLTDTVYLGEFIIPKGATYCLNNNGEVVSDSLMYTGNYIKITLDKAYNTKELWKEK